MNDIAMTAASNPTQRHRGESQRPAGNTCNKRKSGKDQKQPGEVAEPRRHNQPDTHLLRRASQCLEIALVEPAEGFAHSNDQQQPADRVARVFADDQRLQRPRST